MKHCARNFFIITQILLIFMALVPPPAFAARTATLSVEPSSGVITYPTYTINIIISPVTDLWQFRFRLSFNDGDDFLEVPTIGGVELGDLFAGLEPDMNIGNYYLSDTGLSYLVVLIEMPGTETVTSSESKSLAKITFKLLDNAMPGMISWLKLEWADATFYTGIGDPPYEYIDSESGITLQSGTVELDYLVTTLTVNPATATVEKPVTLSSTLKDGHGNPIAGLSVDYYVDSLKIDSVLTNDYGVSSISYTPSDVGTFTIKAEYVGNLPGGKYAGSSDTATLTVNQMSTTLSLSVPPSVIVMDVVDMTATLKKDGTPMSGETVKFYINSVEEGSATTDASGIASMQYTFDSQGTYEVKAEYSGTAKYAGSSDTATVTANKMNTTLSLSVPPSIKVGETVDLAATLKKDGTVMVGSTVSFSILPPGGVWTLIGSPVTDSSGVAVVEYLFDIEGLYEIKAEYPGTVRYTSSSDTTTRMVATTRTVLELTDDLIVTKVDSSVALSATLKDEENNPLENRIIDYYVNSLYVDSSYTDENGFSSIIYTPGEASPPEGWKVEAKYSGSLPDGLTSSVDTATIVVNKLKTALTLSVAETTITVEQTIALTATLEDENEQRIPYENINFFIKVDTEWTKIADATTNVNGIASLDYPPTTTGTLLVKANYAGSQKYSANTSDIIEVTVNKLKTTLTLSVAETTITVEQTITMTATLEDENEIALEGLAIEYYIYLGGAWNSIGTAVTNPSGVATRDYTPSEAGTFLAKANYAGSQKYSANTSDIIEVTVTKVATTLTLGMPTTAKVEQTVMISAALKDEDQKTIPNVTIEYYLLTGALEKTIGSAKTNQNGVASIPYTTTNVGTFHIRAAYSESTKYLASSDTKELTVNPLTTTLTLNIPTTTRVEETVTLTATLKDENEIALEGLAIEYYIYSDGTLKNTSIAVTDSRGIATHDYTPSEAGTFDIHAKFNGDAKHSETTSRVVTLTVNKVKTTLTLSLSNTTATVQTSIVISATLEDEDAQPIARSNVYYEIFKGGEWISTGSATTNLQGVASLNFQPSEAGTFKLRAVYTGDPKYAESTSQEATLEVTGEGAYENPLGFLGDEKLTVLDFLFWGILIATFSIIVVVLIRRKIKSGMQIDTHKIQTPV